MSENTSSHVIESLSAFEMSMAEQTAGLSVATLEDPNFPKVDLLGALGWVNAKRAEPTLTFRAYMESRTLTQITDELGLNEDGDEAAEGNG